MHLISFKFFKILFISPLYLWILSATNPLSGFPPMYLCIRGQRPEYRKVDVGQTTTENASNQLPLVESIATRICCVRMKNEVVLYSTHSSRNGRSCNPFAKPIPNEKDSSTRSHRASDKYGFLVLCGFCDPVDQGNDWKLEENDELKYFKI